MEEMTAVLFVDDNASLCTLYKDIPETAGYSVTTANSGPEAPGVLDTKRSDLVLLDIMMKDMDGWEVLDHIRERDDCADVSVIVLTAKALIPREVLEYGDAIQGFIMKPLLVHILREYLGLVLSERKERDTLLSACGDDASARVCVAEYMTLCQQIRVWDTILSTVEKTFGEMEEDENSDFQAQIQNIRDVIAGKKARFKELSASVIAFTT